MHLTMLHKVSTFALALVALAQAPTQAVAQSLDSIARLAIARNLATRRTVEREREADRGVAQARGLFLPSLSVDSRYSRLDGVVNLGSLMNPAFAALNQLTGTPSFPTNIDATLPMRQESHLRATLPLFNGALMANLAAAHAIEHLRGAEREAAVRRLDADSRIAYLSWGSAARAVEIWDATLPVIEEGARVSQRLVDAGTATADVVLRARAALADARQQRAEAVRRRDAALGVLNLFLDRPADVLVPALADTALPVPPGISLADALSASSRREERAIVAAAIDGARAQGRAAESAFLPSLAVAAEYGFQGNGYRFDRDHDVAVASVVLQWNLFNGGQDAARRESAAAARRGAELQRADLDRQIALDVRTAWDAVQVAREGLDAAGTRLAAARAAFSLVDHRYAEGMTSYLEWSDGRAQLTAAALNEVLSRYTLAARGVDLERAAALRTLHSN